MTAETPGRPHVPVMPSEVLELLEPGGESVILDGTVGAGGHALRLLTASSPGGRLAGIDLDPAALEIAAAALSAFAGRFELFRGNFSDLPEAAVRMAPFDAILLDLGASSMQFDDPSRGFSFSQDGPLDMRMDPSRGVSAADLVNDLPAEDLASIIFELGEERRSRAVARRIVAARAGKPLKSTAELADIVSGAFRNRGRVHPATRTFQALRIAVNGELDNLGVFLEKAPGLLRKGGRVAVMSFHSLEDRLVKRAFRDGAAAGVYRILTRKPLTPAREETLANSRSRSAKLRAAQRI